MSEGAERLRRSDPESRIRETRPSGLMRGRSSGHWRHASQTVAPAYSTAGVMKTWRIIEFRCAIKTVDCVVSDTNTGDIPLWQTGAWFDSRS